jgi:protein SCO1/2
MNSAVTTRAARLAMWLVAVAAAGAALGNDTGAAPRPLPKFDRVMSIDTPRAVVDLEMTDQDGRARRISDLAGAPTLVFFGFTHCPDVCPTTLQKLALIKSSRAKELAGLRVAFISVDGERDTPAAMKEFLKRFPAEFLGLTAPSEQVRSLALGLSAPFFKDPPTDGANGDDYAVQHSSRLFALDRQGRLRAEIYDASPDAIAGVASALLAE